MSSKAEYYRTIMDTTSRTTDIPASHISKKDISLTQDDDIPCGQRTPPTKRTTTDRIRLQDNTYRSLRERGRETKSNTRKQCKYPSLISETPTPRNIKSIILTGRSKLRKAKRSHSLQRKRTAIRSRLKSRNLQHEAKILSKYVKNLFERNLSDIETNCLGERFKIHHHP